MTFRSGEYLGMLKTFIFAARLASAPFLVNRPVEVYEKQSS